MSHDYVQRVSDYFIERRGRGVAISSSDEDLLLRWERQGVPIVDVLHGIDLAFQSAKRPPRSLGEVRRYLKKPKGSSSTGEIGGFNPLAQSPLSDSGGPLSPKAPQAARAEGEAFVRGSSCIAVPPAEERAVLVRGPAQAKQGATSKPRVATSLGDRVLAYLSGEETRHPHPRVRGAFSQLHSEVVELISEEGKLAEDIPPILEMSLCVLVFEACGHDERIRLSDRANLPLPLRDASSHEQIEGSPSLRAIIRSHFGIPAFPERF